MARTRLSGRDTHDARAAPLLAAGAAAAPLLRPARGRRDDHLPAGSALGSASGDRRPTRGSAERRRGVPPLRLQDGNRQRQDDGDGDADRLEHPQQGRRPRRRALLRRRDRRMPEPHDQGPTRRTRPGHRRGVDLPDARPCSARPDDVAPTGPRAGQELARVRAQGDERRREGAKARPAGADHVHDQDRRQDDLRTRRPLHDRRGAGDRPGRSEDGHAHDRGSPPGEARGRRRGNALRRERRAADAATARARGGRKAEPPRAQRRGAPRLSNSAGWCRNRGGGRGGDERGARGGACLRVDRLGRRSRPDPQAPPDQLLRRPLRRRTSSRAPATTRTGSSPGSSATSA